LLLVSDRVCEGYVRRIEPRLGSLPLVPVARQYVAVITTEAAVAASYRDPSSFWAGWDRRVRHGEQSLLVRGTDAPTSAEWFRAIFGREWAMARAARLGTTRIGWRDLPPDEAVYGAGQSCLSFVGRREGEVELACFVPTGAHVPPWEILKWSEAVQRRATQDGAPLTQLSIVFRDEAMAVAEGTPLHDMGAIVQWFGADGLYHTLTP
jgi:hypothetical protein